MNKSELEELKVRIAKTLDVHEFLDKLGFTMFDLVDVLEDYINEQAADFEEMLN